MTTQSSIPAESSIPEPRPGSDFAPRLVAEALGTLLLVAGGVGTAIFDATFPSADNNLVGVGHLGVALAFGLTVVVGAYAFGPISGGHFNPAITLGLAAAGRFPWKDTVGYIVAQVVGGILGSSIVALIASTKGGFFSAARDSGFASNGFGAHSPGGFGIGGAIVVEIVFTAIFVFVVLGTTAKVGATGFAPLAIGLSLALIHLITIPIDNTSVNPARSIAAAVYGGGWAWAQLWVFIVFPIVGGLVAGLSYKPLFGKTFTQAA
ncbi:aquaporin Z [Brooklawnia cerclae]|uniref:Aquaporin Z n=1 Tax=Brooklawnia cerclae TaxID=349934 RepID=A0ABX0SFQ2_9ACTN|nr:aquaporin Z [Brooklawnia cerclae]NIH57174.1 aquaporin Z [Brooklawnia cerclae]